MKEYVKAIWALVSSALGAVTTAVAATPDHTFGQVTDLGWLIAAGSVVFVIGGVYGLPNLIQSPPLLMNPDTAATEARAAALRQQIADLQSQLSRIGA